MSTDHEEAPLADEAEQSADVEVRDEEAAPEEPLTADPEAPTPDADEQRRQEPLDDDEEFPVQ